MPPSAIIDSDWNGTDYYALEATKLWKTSNILAGGAATWTEVLNTTLFAAEIEVNGFSRVRVSGATVYVIGGAGVDAYMFRSSSGGLTWTKHLIRAESLISKPYTVRVNGAARGLPATTWPYHNTAYNVISFERIGDDINTQNPWAFAYKTWNSQLEFEYMEGATTTVESTVGLALPNAAAILDHSAVGHPTPGIIWGVNNWLLGGGAWGPGRAYLDDYFGSDGWEEMGGLNWNMPKEAGRVLVPFQVTGQVKGLFGGVMAWVFWNVPETRLPVALDYARSNPDWLYVGLEDRIVASEDGGITWFDFQTAHGANDICVDPQLAGAIYYWATDGNLNLLVKQTLGQPGVMTSEALDTEIPTRLPLRLARDTNSGRLWGIKSGAMLRMRLNGVWSDQHTELSNARGLNVRTGGKMIFVDANDVWLSDDYGATVTAKKGGWSGFSAGVNAHRLGSS